MLLLDESSDTFLGDTFLGDTFLGDTFLGHPEASRLR
jgi:hypothetical protein